MSESDIVSRLKRMERGLVVDNPIGALSEAWREISDLRHKLAEETKHLNTYINFLHQAERDRDEARKHRDCYLQERDEAREDRDHYAAKWERAAFAGGEGKE